MTHAAPAGVKAFGPIDELDHRRQDPMQNGHLILTDASSPFIEPLVARMSSRYAVPVADIRVLATEIHAQFADVPIRSFIEVLVEKQLRERLRPRPGQCHDRP